MKIKPLILSLCFLVATGSLFSPVKAQGSPYSDTLSRLYDSLNPQYLNTGLLYSKFPLSILPENVYSPHPYSYNGAPSAPSGDVLAYLQLGQNFEYGDMGDSIIPPDDTLASRVNYFWQQPEITLGGFNLAYQYLHPEAVQNGWILYDHDDRVYKNMPDSLHVQDTVLDNQGNIVGYADSTIYLNGDSLAKLALPQKLLYFLFTVKGQKSVVAPGEPLLVNLDPSLFISNRILPALSIDLDDGNGWQPIIPGTPLVVNYLSFGEKTIRLRFHEQFGSGEYPIASCKVTVMQRAPDPDQVIDISSISADLPCGKIDDGYGFGFGKMSILYADNKNPVLTRPVIIVEGFDSEINSIVTLNWNNPLLALKTFNMYNSDLHGYGSLNWHSLVTGKSYKGNDLVFEWISKLPELVDSLRDNGYDIIYVDWQSSLAHIQSNTNALMKIINWVNQTKTTDEELVIVGASMGGLITRTALARLEKMGCCHETRLWVSFDSPHEGANIPLSIQEFIHIAGKEYDSKSAKMLENNVLNSPAASQMLIYHRNLTSSALRSAFKVYLDDLGYPQNCYRTAIINGSKEGLELGFGPGDILVKLEWTWDAPGGMNTLPPGVFADLDQLIIFQSIAYATPNSPSGPSNAVMVRHKKLWNTLLNYFTLWGIYGTTVYTNSVLTPQIATIICSNCPLCCPLAIAGVAIAQSGVATASDALLSYIFDQNNNVLESNEHFTLPTLAYDNCPGGMSNTMQSIEDQSPNNIIWYRGVLPINAGTPTAYFPNHCFVPSVSALGIKTTDISMNIQGNNVVANNLTPFDDFYAPVDSRGKSPNEMHIQITDENIHYLMEQVRNNRPDLTGVSSTLNASLNGSYNWGASEKSILHNVTIQNGGRMYVNRDQPTGFGVGTSNPPLYGSFELNTSLCGSHIIVRNGGLFELGQNNAPSPGSPNNRAEVYFRKNSILEIHGGGVLRINDNSLLKLEAGSEIILHPGAIIDLNGSGAVLELGGKITLLPNAELNPSGQGILRFAQQAANAAAAALFWNCQGHNKLIVAGNNQQRRLETVYTTYFPVSLESVDLTGIEVGLAPGTGLHILTSPTTIEYNRFTSTDTPDKHLGVYLYGQSLFCEHNTFQFGVIGLYDNLSLGTGTLNLSDCIFTDNSTGLVTDYGQTNLTNCQFEYNNSGWNATNVQGTSLAVGCSFMYHSIRGVNFRSQPGVLLELEECDFMYNQVGLEAEEASVRPTCCSFSYNTGKGIMALSGCKLLLNNNAVNGFYSNSVAIYVVNGYIPLLRDGKNNFTNSGKYVSGVLPYCNCSQMMDVYNNVMPAISARVLSTKIDLYNPGPSGNIPISVLNWSSSVSVIIGNYCANTTGKKEQEGNNETEPSKDSEPDTEHRPSSGAFPGDVKIYPNPATDQVFVSHVWEDEAVSIRVLDAKGQCQLLLEFKPGEEITFSLAHLSPGIYTVELIKQDGVKTFKLTKQP